MPRLLVINRESKDLSWLRNAPSLQHCEIVAVDYDIEALHLLRHQCFDLVLTDPTTPIGKDLALVKEIQRACPGVRVIVMTPEASTHELIEALRAHVFACFSTTGETDEIVSMIERALEETDWKDGINIVSARPDWIALKVESKKVTAERLIRLMDELKTDLPDEQHEALMTAFREILLNAMEHGAGFNPEYVIEVSAVRAQNSLIYYFRDPGAGFNRENLPHSALSNTPEDPLAHMTYREEMGLRPGGFGILLTRQLVDELIYNEEGNEVMLIKYLKKS